MRRSAVAVGGMLEQLDAQVGPALGEHAPHRARLRAAEVREHGVAEVDVRRVAGLHPRAVALGEGAVEALDDPDRVRAHASSRSAMKPPGRAPGGSANTALPTWQAYAESASCAASRRCSTANCRRGSRW